MLNRGGYGDCLELRLYDFVCAWFDERHYFEFYPLHVVHKRRSPRRYQ